MKQQHAGLIEAVDNCAERLHHLNQNYPLLATPASLEGVQHWRQRRAHHRLRHKVPPAELPEGPNIRAITLDLLQHNGLEDTLDILLDKHDVDLSLPKLIHLVGKEAYIAALKREAALLLANAISYEQIANLWNDLDRPALGGASWSPRSVSVLAS